MPSEWSEQKMVVSSILFKVDGTIRHWKCAQLKAVQKMTFLPDQAQHRNNLSFDFPELLGDEVEVGRGRNWLSLSLRVVLTPAVSKITAHGEDFILMADHGSRQWHRRYSTGPVQFGPYRVLIILSLSGGIYFVVIHWFIPVKNLTDDNASALFILLARLTALSISYATDLDV
jgi:hypothetical protein